MVSQPGAHPILERIQLLNSRQVKGYKLQHVFASGDPFLEMASRHSVSALSLHLLSGYMGDYDPAAMLHLE
jgi:hypothetical protein